MTASMEDLVRYCVQEIAHDGDLGSTLSRVGSFMNEFYTRNPPPDEQQRTTFQALFEELRKQPHIQIGLAPTATTEVIIGQPEKKPEKKKSTLKRSSIQTVEPATPDPDVMELGETGMPPKSPADGLELVPDVDAVPAMDLVGNYGERLRIAVDAEFSSLTLTRIADRTVPRTNPRLYTCLQFIARSRGNGLSADAVAAATGYDLKICYHHIRHLAAMDLIQKLRKNDFTRVDFCVHRDYLHLVPDDWTYSPRTTRDSQQGTSARGSVADDAEFESGSERLDPTHEGTPRLLRERVVALLKAGQDTALPYAQLFAAAGYKSDQGSQDWDFFCATVEDMVRDGELVKSLKKAAAGAPVLCVRLPGDQPPDPVAARMQPTRMRPRKSINNNGSTTIDDDDSSVDTAPPVSTSMKRGAEDGPTGEPPLKRKRGRPRKDEVEARAATQPTPDPKSAKKDDSHARDASPPWATKRKAGPRPPSPAYVPKRIPTPPWAEVDRPGRPQTPPPPPPPKHTPASLAKLDPAIQMETAVKMIEELERRNEGLVAAAELLTAKDLRTLLPGHLPNPTVMDALNGMMMVNSTTIPKVHIGSSALYPYIIDAIGATGDSNDPVAWHKVLRFQERINLFALHRFIIPVYLPERWICACIDFKAKMISIYDSMPKPLEKLHMNTIRALSTWLDHEAKARAHPPPDWKIWKADSTPKDVVKSDVKPDTGFYTWLFARTLVVFEKAEMNFRLDVASERIWLIVDGVQSLEHKPVPPPGTSYEPGGPRVPPRMAPRVPPQQQGARGVPQVHTRPPGSARPPVPVGGQRPPPPPPQQHQRPSPAPARPPPASAPARPPPAPAPAPAPGQGQRPSPVPVNAQRPSPAPPRAQSSGSYSGAGTPPALPARTSPEVATRPRQGSAAAAPPPAVPVPQARRPSQDGSSAKENQAVRAPPTVAPAQ